MGVFYADDGIIGSRDPEWLQGDKNVLFGIFRRFRLMTNVEKSKTMTFQLGVIHTGMPERVLSRRSKGEGGTYQDRLQRRISFPDFGLYLTDGFMTAHRRKLHWTEPAIDWN